jgi:hypothetical protein
LDFKYKPEIFDAIITACLEYQVNQNNSYGPSWTYLYEHVKLSLGRELSSRDFVSHIKNMIIEGILFEIDLGRRGTRKSISLTDNAKRLHGLGILGQSKQEVNCKKVLQLLIFFHLIRPPKLISEKTLYNILSSFSISRRDLVRYIESHFHHLSNGYTETNYKPVNDYKFRIVETYVGEKKITRYYCKRISFTVDDVIRYTKIHKKVAIDIDNTRTFPFIKNIRFPKLTDSEIKKAFDILKRYNIISPTLNSFDEPGKQIAFIISDNELQDFIRHIWHVRNLELERLDKKLTTLRGPTEEEKKWLELTYGSNYASIIVHDATRTRNGRWNKRKYALTQIEKRIESLENRINQQILNIKETYLKIIERFDFPPNIVEGICLNKIF